ncbi:MAG: glycoside hydrolase family 3 protein [Patescibacteria group bacterium]|nr:glycoside hydrolase family 3 protein [Patescibacteria group bacterium]MBU1876763.1 glycoside hydrolase family 3 protein [Patescibacteria group bacterium]
MIQRFFQFIKKYYLLIIAGLIIGQVFIVGFRGINTPKDLHIDNIVLNNNLKNKIGQMVIIGFRGIDAPEDSYIANIIKELKIGGVILFDYDVPSKSYPRNIINPGQTEKLISDLKNYSTTPLFISVDAEGGIVNRLKPKYGFIPIMSAKEMGVGVGISTTIDEAKKLSLELKELGFNMNFAPVVDVDINPNNPVIGGLERSFSADYENVVEQAKAFIKEQRENGIISVAKHFPGHGSSENDSHLGLVDVTKTYKSEELIPYEELQKEGVLDVVMTAHIINTDIDKDYPATLSLNFLQNILREKIGFEGVIVSDDMQMNAIASNYGFDESIIRAINAGCDILIISNNSTSVYDEQLPYKTINIIYEAIKDGKISMEKINESYDRIMKLKEQFNII